MQPHELRNAVESLTLRDALSHEYTRRGLAPLDAAPPVITYVRYKPGTSALVGLRLRTKDGTEHLGYIKWFLAGGAAECHAKYAGRTRGDGWTVPVADGDALYFHFPLDRTVRGLPWLVSPDGLKHTVHEALRDRPAETGGALGGARLRAHRMSVEILKYKPERRCIVKAAAATKNDASGERGLVRFSARAYGEAPAADPIRLLGALHEAGERGALPGSVPRPLAHHEGRRILVQAWIDGTTLDEQMRRGDAMDTVRAAGRYLGALRAMPIDALRAVRARDHAPTITAMAQDLLRAGVAGGGMVQRLEERLLRAAMSLEEPPPSLLHGDFHYHQVLATEGGAVAVIDWDEAMAGDPLFDVGNFTAHLRLREMEGVAIPEGAGRLREEFLGAFLAEGGVPRGLPFYEAFQLFRLAAVPLRNLREDWTVETTRIIEHAEAILRKEAVPC